MIEVLAIAIPVYNNTLLLKQCLNSLQLQTFKKFDIYLYDDASTEDYLSVVDSFSHLSLNYKRNEKNLGALANMQYAFNDLKDKYAFVMIMHEDDLLHVQFIEIVNKFISLNVKPSFVMSNFISFDKEDELKKYNATKYYVTNPIFMNKASLSMQFLQLKPLAFGSVIYNTNFYKTTNFNFDQYEEFADRPFLLNGLNEMSQVAIINEAVYYYRSHGINDNRWKKLLPQHVFNLLDLYKSILVKSNYISNKSFNKHAMAFIFDAYNNLLLTGKKYSFILYLIETKKKGFFSLKYALLKISIVNKIGTQLKKYI